MKDYIINSDQLENLEDLSLMLQGYAETLKDMACKSKSELLHGFELGKLHSDIFKSFQRMLELQEEIKDQAFNNE